MVKWGLARKDQFVMAAESIVLSPRVQASLQALKQAAESEAAVVRLVTQAVQGGGQTLSSPSTNLNRLLDIFV
jgi:hypothetical protein